MLSASRGFDQISALVAKGTTLAQVAANADLTSAYQGYQAWSMAPRFLGVPVICNLPALLITAIITYIVYIGIQESKRTSNFLVAVKVLVVILVIITGAYYVHPENWHPFMPNSMGGVLKGVSAVFFAYIGFDAISTTAEECKNPQRDLPRAMIYSLVICTILYVLVALVLTGVVNYKKLAVGDPLAFVFGPEGANVHWINAVVSVTAVIALATVLLVFQLGQPRIWMSMSRDGLLPPIFGAIHPKYRTPWFSTILTGLFVAIPSLFMNLTEVTDLTSIGTLFAFVLVCGGLLRLNPRGDKPRGKFQTPYINGKWIFPVILVAAIGAVYYFYPESVHQFFSNVDPTQPGVTGWDVFKHKIPLASFLIGMLALIWLTFKYELSLIPVLGVTTSGYLMTELGITNWLRFGIWLIVGLFLYFVYGSKHSKLAQQG
jgi:APA family basic amino acid/polyamine antiporter